MRFALRRSSFLLVAMLFLAASSRSQNAPALPVYPESVEGLRSLVQDILQAQKQNDQQRVNALIQSLVIPDYRQWYLENFEFLLTDNVLPRYEKIVPVISEQLAPFFASAQSDGFTEIGVLRFDDDCSANPGLQVINVLNLRHRPMSLFELRFSSGTNSRRLFAFAYINGGFRYVIVPNFNSLLAPPLHYPATTNTQDTANVRAPRIKRDQQSLEPLLVHASKPAYPSLPPDRRFTGFVLLHATIDVTGHIQNLYVIQGNCVFSRPALETVRQWRYKPIFVGGKPVEVDTILTIVFQADT